MQKNYFKDGSKTESTQKRLPDFVEVHKLQQYKSDCSIFASVAIQIFAHLQNHFFIGIKSLHKCYII